MRQQNSTCWGIVFLCLILCHCTDRVGWSHVCKKKIAATFSAIPKFQPAKQGTTAWQSQGAKVQKLPKMKFGTITGARPSFFLTLRQTCFAGHIVVSFWKQSKPSVHLFSEILGNDTKELQHDCALLATCYFAGTQEVIRCPQATSTYRQCEDWRPTPGSSIRQSESRIWMDLGDLKTSPHWAPGRPRFLPPLDFCLCIFLREGNCTRNAKWIFYRQIVRYYQCIISRNRNEKLKQKWKYGTSNAVGEEVAKMLKGCEKVLLCSWSASKEKLRMSEKERGGRMCTKILWQEQGTQKKNTRACWPRKSDKRQKSQISSIL